MDQVPSEEEISEAMLSQMGRGGPIGLNRGIYEAEETKRSRAFTRTAIVNKYREGEGEKPLIKRHILIEGSSKKAVAALEAATEDMPWSFRQVLFEHGSEDGVLFDSDIPESAMEWMAYQFHNLPGRDSDNAELRWPEDKSRAMEVWAWWAVNSKDPSIQSRFRIMFPDQHFKNPLDFTITEMEDVMDSLTPLAEQNARNERWSPEELGYDSAAARTVYDKDGLMVVEITKKLDGARIASKYASGTRWCTSNEGTSQHYLNQGPLYVVFINGKKYAQIHGPSQQICDIRDRPIQNLPGPVAQMMLNQYITTFDEVSTDVKDVARIRKNLFDEQERVRDRRIEQLQTIVDREAVRSGALGISEADPLRRAVLEPLLDMQSAIRSGDELKELKSLSITIDDHEVEREVRHLVEQQEQLIRSLTRFRKATDELPPEDPKILKYVHELIEEDDPEEWDGEPGVDYLIANTHRRDPVLEKWLVDPTREGEWGAAISYFQNTTANGLWPPGTDRWPKLEKKMISQLDETLEVSPWLGHVDPPTPAQVAMYLAIGDNPWRSPKLLLSSLEKEPQSRHRMDQHDLLYQLDRALALEGRDPPCPACGEQPRPGGVDSDDDYACDNEDCGTSYYKLEQSVMPVERGIKTPVMPTKLARKIIAQEDPKRVLRFADLFPPQLIGEVVVDEEIEEIAEESEELITQTSLQTQSRGSEGFNIDAQMDLQEEILTNLRAGKAMTSEMWAVFYIYIEPKLSAEERLVREVNVAGRPRPPGTKQVMCDDCHFPIEYVDGEWKVTEDIRSNRDAVRGLIFSNINGIEGPLFHGQALQAQSEEDRLESIMEHPEWCWTKRVGVVGGDDSVVSNPHDPTLPIAFVACNQCGRWRPLNRERRDNMDWSQKRHFEGMEQYGTGLKCACTYKMANEVLYAPEEEEEEDEKDAEERREVNCRCGAILQWDTVRRAWYCIECPFNTYPTKDAEGTEHPLIQDHPPHHRIADGASASISDFANANDTDDWAFAIGGFATAMAVMVLGNLVSQKVTQVFQDRGWLR